MLWLGRPGVATLWVEHGGPAVPGTARCPQGTIEDHNACVPVPKTQPEELADFVPKLPGRPDALAEYALPLVGSAELVDIAAAPVPASMQLPGRALVVRPPSSTELSLASLRLVGEVEILAHDSQGGWLLLGLRAPEAPPSHLMLVAGVRQLRLTEANPAQALGTVDALWLSTRQLRPGAELNAEAWSVDGSIPVDPRNVLPLSSAPD